MANLYRKWSLTPYYFSFLQFVTNMFSKRQFDWCSVSIGHEIELHCFMVQEGTCQDGIAG